MMILLKTLLRYELIFKICTHSTNINQIIYFIHLRFKCDEVDHIDLYDSILYVTHSN
jgi:hypothetical protein